MPDLHALTLLVVTMVLFHRSPTPYERLRALIRELRSCFPRFR